MLLEPQCPGSITSSWHPLCLEIDFFGRFLLRLSLIKPSLAMSMVKFIHRSFNFGYDFVLLVHFFWDTVQISTSGSAVLEIPKNTFVQKTPSLIQL